MIQRRLVRRGLAPGLVALVCVLASAAPVLADLGLPAVYEIEAKEQYCSDGTTACVAPNAPPDLGNLRFAQFEAYRLTTSGDRVESTDHDTFTPPEVILAKCAGPYSMDGRGNVHTRMMSVMVGPSPTNLDAGTITGSASIEAGLATDVNSNSVVALEVSDLVTGDSAVITGNQVADNVTDALVGGGFFIYLSGPQYDEIVAGPDANQSAPPKPTGASGTMRCNTGNTTVSTPGAPPAFFDSEVYPAMHPGS
ncbi:MAG: hypothetical protein JO020_35235 [Chloroflexi bacterium]|nr:hypothetical protein [Chloroflexota bacterium]